MQFPSPVSPIPVRAGPGPAPFLSRCFCAASVRERTCTRLPRATAPAPPNFLAPPLPPARPHADTVDMEVPIYQVDAFARAVFTGNPAAVCPLKSWLPDATLQAIAMENNLSETAFFVKQGAGYHLRWFTPASEIDLCGHATLASAWVILEKLEPGRPEVVFHTLSGELRVARKLDLLTMDFPSRPPRPVVPHARCWPALGGHPSEVLGRARLHGRL